VLTKATIAGSKDKLLGLKENVIMGRLIPSGTGDLHLRDIEIKDSDVQDEPALDIPRSSSFSDSDFEDLDDELE